MNTFLQITQSVFNKHELLAKHADSIERNVSYNFIGFLSIFTCCALVIYVYLRFYKKTLLVFSSVISYGASQQIQREGHSFVKSFSLALFFIYTICAGVFFTDLCVYKGWFAQMPVYLIKVGSILIVLAIILVRRFINQVLGLMIKEKNATEDMFFQYAFGIYISAFVMLFCSLLLHYSKIPPGYLFPAGISVLGAIYSVRVVKTLLLGRTIYGFSLFHLVLYLCAVEIIPLAVFVKVIVNS